MKRTFILIFALIGITALLAVSLAIAKDQEAAITGTWNCQAKGGENPDMSFTLYLHQSGESVDGSVSSPIGDAPINSGTFKNGTLEIQINAPEGDYVLVAKLDKGALSGTWSRNDKKGTWDGKKEAAGSQ